MYKNVWHKVWAMVLALHPRFMMSWRLPLHGVSCQWKATASESGTALDVMAPLGLHDQEQSGGACAAHKVHMSPFRVSSTVVQLQAGLTSRSASVIWSAVLPHSCPAVSTKRSGWFLALLSGIIAVRQS